VTPSLPPRTSGGADSVDGSSHGEEFFRAAFLASAIPSSLVSPDGYVLRANRALEKLLQYDPGGLNGLRVTEFTDLSDQALTEEAIARGREPGTAVMELHKRYLRRDGTAVDTLVSIATVRDHLGVAQYYTTQIVDLSDLRRAEVAVLERERVFGRLAAIQQEIMSAAMDEAGLVPLIVDRACELVDADVATVELVDGDALVVRPGSRVGPALVGARLSIADSMAGVCVRRGEAVYCPDAATDARARASLEQHPDARTILCVPLSHEGRVGGVLKLLSRTPDAFPDRAIDLARVLGGFAAAALNHARDYARFRAVIENSADPIIMIDAAGKLTYVSPSYEKLFGSSGEALIGVSALDLVHPDDRDRAAGAIRELVRHAARDLTGEFRARFLGDSWRTVRVTARNLLQEPAVGAIVINLHDVTEETRMALRLRQGQKLEAVGQLAGGVAHDLNNILTVINGNCEFLAAQLAGQEGALGDVSEIQRAAARATALTRQLLAFSRQQMLQPHVVDLNAIAAGLRPMLSRLIHEDIEVAIATGPDPVTIFADPNQVEQVVVNLAVNARDAMPAGGRLEISVWVQQLSSPVEFETHTVPEGRYAVLTVSDTGTGMTREVKEQMFNPFFTTKEVGRGTGLGLATVYGIVKQSGGYIDVQTAPGEGTRIRIFIPLVDEELPEPLPKPSETPAVGSATVLLVEDDPAVRAIARRILLRNGYHVLDADGPGAALEISGRHLEKLDLLLTDVVMPKMNGRQLWEALRERHPEAEVVYMSGYTNDDILRRGGVVGTHVRMVGKPFSPDDLLAAVRDALGPLKKR
jgi:PAS domain S-box-containing protein